MITCSSCSQFRGRVYHLLTFLAQRTRIQLTDMLLAAAKGLRCDADGESGGYGRGAAGCVLTWRLTSVLHVAAGGRAGRAGLAAGAARWRAICLGPAAEALDGAGALQWAAGML